MADAATKTRRGRRRRRVPSRRSRFRGWDTTDAEEIERRRQRAAEGPMEIEPLEPGRGFFGTFRVSSEGGGTYDVEVRSLTERLNSCGCPDHRVNGLGTCKHVEAVLAELAKRPKGARERAARQGSRRLEIFLDPNDGAPRVCARWPPRSHARSRLRDLVEPFFSADGTLLGEAGATVPTLARRLEAAPPSLRRRVRLSRQLLPWAAEEARRAARRRERETFLADLAAGRRTLDLVRHPLYPYQQEGVLHLAFTERALLGDDMGLGKTVQAIAACELLRRLRGVERVLVVSPVSLKGEWEEQIAKFSGLTARLIAGPRPERLRRYRQPVFFYLTNYEQIVADAEHVQRLVAPDVVILDEAQRIKNWRTQTAGAVKRLESRYAFVLTGTPLENRIDDVYSIVQFLDPSILGPLFRFNRDFYALDDRGRPVGYKNLGELHRRLKPVLLRRRKEEVEDQLPGRTVNTYFVAMEPEQAERYEEYNTRVGRLLAALKRRPLTPEEFDKLQQWLACMRMLCDTPFILDPDCRICPKLGELEEILAEGLAEEGRKMLIFSEWERMLQLVRERVRERGVDFAWHTGSVPQEKRREEIRRFKTDPDCRLFLSTDSGSVGLNLQAASTVIHLDLPWNPARLEQRIARAWRKHQRRSVQVIQLVTEGSIEQRMLHVLAGKQALADGVLDGKGDLDALPMPSGRAAFIERLEEIMGRSATPPGAAAADASDGAEPLERLRQEVVTELGDALLLVEAAEPAEGRATVLAVVEGEASRCQPALAAALRRAYGGGADLPRMEVLDRATYEALQRLIEAGLLVPAAGGRRVLHRSPALAEPGAAAAERARRLEEARHAFESAERQQRMAAVLLEGGFPEEAAPPLATALRGALTCLMHLAGGTALEANDLSATALDSLRGADPPAGTLASRALPLLTSLEERQEKAGVDGEAEARRWVDEARQLFADIEEALGRASLGVGGSLPR